MKRRNQLMLWISFLVVTLSFIIHGLHRFTGFSEGYQIIRGNVTAASPATLTWIALLPLVCWVASAVLYRIRSNSPAVALLLTLTLTFSSMSIVAGGNGLVEYHFSIFMVLALIAYFRRINLILVSTILFAVQHFAGFFFAPALICGTTGYPFSILMIHAVFLILTSVALIIQIAVQNQERSASLQRETEATTLMTNVSQQIESLVGHLKTNTKQLQKAAVQSVEATNQIATAIAPIVQSADGQHQSNRKWHGLSRRRSI